MAETDVHSRLFWPWLIMRSSHTCVLLQISLAQFTNLIVIHFIPYIGDPVLDLISQDSGLIVYNGGHSKGDKA